MAEPRYQSARDVAPRLHAHFLQLRATSSAASPDDRPPAPSIEDIEAVLDAAFWASLRREENYLPRISLALMPPSAAARPLMFDRPLPLRPVSLVKVAPAVERPGIHLGVWSAAGTLRVWGTTRIVPPTCLVLEVAAPGLIVVKHHREASNGKFVNVVVLEAERIKMIDDRARMRPDCPHLISTLLGFDPVVPWATHPGVLVELAVSMRAHGRGGTMLVVPAASRTWEESIVKPLPYAVSPIFGALTELVSRPRAERQTRDWQDEMDDTVQVVAGLTAVDGAVLISDRLELVAFGVKIARREGSPLVEQTAVTEPIEGGEASVVHPSRLGGTRHLSAAQFVHDQRDAVAMVASQDGRFTIFCWSPVEGMVHAHRVETLLL
ncbi:MAG: hypothetical protein U0Q11_28465 [Vicinamibacterales bacterium]